MIETEPTSGKLNVWAAAFDGFRVLRERPVAAMSITAWSVLLFLVPVVLSQLIPFIEHESLRTTAQLVSGLVLVVLFLGMPVAWLRLVVMNEIKPGCPLRLGKDEWRFGGAFFLIHAAGGLATLCALPVVYGAVALVQMPQTPPPWPMSLLPMTLMMVPYVWVFARLGPSFALGMRRQRLLVGVSWKATRPIRFTLLLYWLPLLAGSLFVPGRNAEPRSSGEVVSPDILSVIAILTAFVLLTGWAISIHAAVARHLLEIDPDLGLAPKPAP